MTLENVKYSRTEFERRALVSGNDWRQFIEPYSKTLNDTYFRDSRLRLRVLTESDSDRRLVKLTKKYESETPFFQEITSIILSPAEHHLFDALAGDRLEKTRYYHHLDNQIFSIDVFAGHLEGLVLCETESHSIESLMSAEFPAYAGPEVTQDVFFTGGNLCRITSEELRLKLKGFHT